MAPLPDLPAMTEEEFELLNEFMTQRFGIHYPEHKRENLISRLAPRLKALHLHRYMDYYILLQYSINGHGEVPRLASLVTNNESYFFRETQQFQTFFVDALDDLKGRASGRETLRVLCAGCSSGEEPYTLNIFAKENQFRMWGWNFDIQAFDLDPERVAMARGAEYGSGSLRTLDETRRLKYFQDRGEDRWALKPMFQRGVTIQGGNILDLASYPRPLPYDAVFCRNVLIYFEEGALRSAITNFAHCLRPGGLLFLGHSESIIGLTAQFEPVKLGEGIVYRRGPD